MEECVHRLIVWKEGMEKELSVNMGKTKLMIGGTNLDILQTSGRFPCGFCHTSVGRNSAKCNECEQWVHKKCSGLKRVTEDLQRNFRCARCQGTARPIGYRPQKDQRVGSDTLEVEAFFCYLGDMLSAAGGCELSTTMRVKTP